MVSIEKKKEESWNEKEEITTVSFPSSLLQISKFIGRLLDLVLQLVHFLVLLIPGNA